MAMTFSDAHSYYSAIIEASAVRDGAVDRMLVELRKAAMRYAHLRAQWALAADAEERADIDHARKAAHDSFIDSCNALSRAMAHAGLNVRWRDQIGDERNAEGRKSIGDFACIVCCADGLAAR